MSKLGMCPVKLDQEYDVKIETIGDKGDGIAKIDNFVIIIPGAGVNERVRVRIKRALDRVAFAEVVERLG